MGMFDRLMGKTNAETSTKTFVEKMELKEQDILSLKRRYGGTGDTYMIGETIDLGELMDGTGTPKPTRVILEKGDTIAVTEFDLSEFDKYAALNAAENKYGYKRVRISVSNSNESKMFYIPESELEGKKIKIIKAVVS